MEGKMPKAVALGGEGREGEGRKPTEEDFK